MTLTAAGSRSFSVRCTGEYKEQIYLGPQRRFGRTPLVLHLFPVSLLFENSLLKKTHILLLIYNRNILSLWRIKFLSTERQQRLKTTTLCTMLVIITQKSHYPFLEFSWSAALYVSSSLARPLLSLPNSTALLSFLFVARQSRGVFRGSHVGRCAAVTWGVARKSREALRGSHVGRCAAVTWGVARSLRGSTP